MNSTVTAASNAGGSRSDPDLLNWQGIALISATDEAMPVSHPICSDSYLGKAMSMEFDYIIVGAGSTGCVLASRLSESPSNKVLLLEAGQDAAPWQIRMPLAVDALLNGTEYNWGFSSEPIPGANNRQVRQPRGRVVGGSSAINGMVYTRGNPQDYDEWESLYGCSGWNYNSLLPYFRRMEHAPWGDPKYRGHGGPLKVTRPDIRDKPLQLAFLKAGRELGYPVSDDYNGAQQEGFAVEEQTISGGSRISAATAYLTPDVRARSNLVIIPSSVVSRIVFTESRATGVKVLSNGNPESYACRKEVVLCAGAVGSPHLLKLSGIGPAQELRSHGIEVLHDNPEVGRNLQDHPLVSLRFACRRPVSLFRYTRFPRKAWAGIQWFANRSGITASNNFEVAAYIRSRSGVSKPDFKLEFFPLALSPYDYKPYPFEAFQVVVTLQNAKSRGKIALRSGNISDAPAIHLNFLESGDDIASFREGVKLTREIVRSSSFSDLYKSELDPGDEFDDPVRLEEWIRQRVSTAYHTSCTCRMGPKGRPGSVVDTELKVKGVSGLRIADTSVLPNIISANTNATAMMLGERAADLVNGTRLPEAQDAEYWIAPNWRTSQR
jgi:choline dehydrogenase